MNTINDKTIEITSGEELKQILENTNNYEYIYFLNNITLTQGININENKTKIIIDGNSYTLTGIKSNEISDTITPNINNTEIELRNMTINYSNTNSPIYIPNERTYNILITYNNVTFKGTKLANNPYGTVKIIDSNITITTIENTSPQEVCTLSKLIIGGETTILNESTNHSLFNFRNTPRAAAIFLCKSNIIMTTDTKEFMTGTNQLNLTILHDTTINIITGNGFSNNPVYGTNNVLIEERATFNLLEKSHQRVPMWSVFGSITMKENSNLEIINSYNNTPDDNYNIFFKGTNQKITLENPNKVIIYTKNANVLHTTNNVEFSIKCTRINMWINSNTLTNAGDINNLPDFAWYKENKLFEINGIISSNQTTITSHNLTNDELTKLPDLNNFSFTSKKQLSIGNMTTNIHQIDTTKNTISGHTKENADVLIKYNNNSNIISANENGLFTYQTPDIINDNTEIEITTNIGNSFIYETRKITTPYNGELSILNKISTINFEFNKISTNPLLFPKTKEFSITVIDSRKTSSEWKIKAYITKQLTSQNGFLLENALVFKKLDNEIITLTTTPTTIFQSTNDQEKTIITWSKEKGPLLDLTNKGLEINEEYFADIHFNLEE